jgi:hypothetical protein
MGTIPPGGFGGTPRAPQDDWVDEPPPRPHYGRWAAFTVGSLLAALVAARRQGKSPGGVLVRGFLLFVGAVLLIVLANQVYALFLR